MPKLVVAVFALLLATTTAQACKVCRPKVQAAIHTPDFTANALLMLLPVALLVGGALLLYFSPNLARWNPTTPQLSTARP
jgi:hypothetical protein